MKLCLRSFLTCSFRTIWPPESVDKIFFDNGMLTLEYRDEWNPFERPTLPWGLDQEGIWRAAFDPRKERWRLRKVKNLEYFGADRKR